MVSVELEDYRHGRLQVGLNMELQSPREDQAILRDDGLEESGYHRSRVHLWSRFTVLHGQVILPSLLRVASPIFVQI